jgi:hypothetical protein
MVSGPLKCTQGTIPGRFTHCVRPCRQIERSVRVNDDHVPTVALCRDNRKRVQTLDSCVRVEPETGRAIVRDDFFVVRERRLEYIRLAGGIRKMRKASRLSGLFLLS